MFALLVLILVSFSSAEYYKVPHDFKGESLKVIFTDYRNYHDTVTVYMEASINIGAIKKSQHIGGLVVYNDLSKSKTPTVIAERNDRCIDVYKKGSISESDSSISDMRQKFTPNRSNDCYLVMLERSVTYYGSSPANIISLPKEWDDHSTEDDWLDENFRLPSDTVRMVTTGYFEVPGNTRLWISKSPFMDKADLPKYAPKKFKRTDEDIEPILLGYPTITLNNYRGISFNTYGASLITINGIGLRNEFAIYKDRIEWFTGVMGYHLYPFVWLPRFHKISNSS